MPIFLCWLFGLPESVIATISSAVLGLGVEDTGLAVFHWADGLVAELASSFLFAAADSSIEVYGTEGTLLVSGVDLASRDITESRVRPDLSARAADTRMVGSASWCRASSSGASITRTPSPSWPASSAASRRPSASPTGGRRS